MKAEITFDLVMDDNMPFVEGCYRVEGDEWGVFIFRHRHDAVQDVEVRKDLLWKSGVRGLNVLVADHVTLNKPAVLRILSETLGVTGWSEVRGPDSIKLR